ncbi:MAG: hypothetical protein EBR81_10330 [Proteobacteria bacterium]|nr:hypothetical protein [Pseudomonadota bacterium]
MSESEFTPALARNGAPIGAACTDKSRGSEASGPTFAGLLEAGGFPTPPDCAPKFPEDDVPTKVDAVDASTFGADKLAPPP